MIKPLVQGDLLLDSITHITDHNMFTSSSWPVCLSYDFLLTLDCMLAKQTALLLLCLLDDSNVRCYVINTEPVWCGIQFP